MSYGDKLPVLRSVVSEEVAPGEPGYKLFTLECGHVMLRKAKAGRERVKCTVCTREGPSVGEVRIIRIPLGASEPLEDF